MRPADPGRGDPSDARRIAPALADASAETSSLVSKAQQSGRKLRPQSAAHPRIPTESSIVAAMARRATEEAGGDGGRRQYVDRYAFSEIGDR